jgi:hypothetical protein
MSMLARWHRLFAAAVAVGALACGSSVDTLAAGSGGETSSSSSASSASTGSQATGNGGAGQGGVGSASGGGGAGGGVAENVPAHLANLCPQSRSWPIACLAIQHGNHQVAMLDPTSGQRCEVVTVDASIDTDQVSSFAWEGMYVYACDRDPNQAGTVARFDISSGVGERGVPADCVTALGWGTKLVLGGTTVTSFDSAADAFDGLSGTPLPFFPFHVYNNIDHDTLYAYDASDDQVKLYAMPSLSPLNQSFANPQLRPFDALDDGRIVLGGASAVQVISPSFQVLSDVALSWSPRALECWVP